MTAQFVSSVDYAAVAQWAAVHVYAAGAIIRPLTAPSDANARCYKTTAGGTSGAVEPTWTFTKGAVQPADGTVTDWTEVTGAVRASPHSRISNAITNTWAGAGDLVYVADNHSYSSSASISLQSQGTFASPVKVVGYDHTTGNATPTSADLKTGWTESTTGNISFSISGNAVSTYFYGGTLNIGSGANAVVQTMTQGRVRWEKCTFAPGSTNSGSGLLIGSGAGTDVSKDFVDCTFSFSSANQSITYGFGALRFLNCTFNGSALPTTLFNNLTGTWATGGSIYFDGCDLSAFGSGKTLIGAFSATASYQQLLNCKLGASVTIAATPTTPAGQKTDVISSDSAAGASRQERYVYEGTLTTETTVVRTGGASDGTTPYSHKIVTTANSSWVNPFEGFQITKENVVQDAFSNNSITATIEIINDGTTLNTNDIWVEAEYMNGASFPQAARISSGVDVLSAGSAVPTSTAAWTTTGITTPVKQKLQVTFTPLTNGLIRFVVKVAKVSQTLWIDPRVTLS